MSNILQLDPVRDANGRSGISVSRAPHGSDVSSIPYERRPGSSRLIRDNLPIMGRLSNG